MRIAVAPLLFFIAVLLSRLASVAFLWGNIHPDELHQSLTVTFRRAFPGREDVQVPWEHSSRAPLRSALSTALFSYLPHSLAAATGSPTPFLLYVAPRATAAALSMVVDGAVFRLARAAGDVGSSVPLASWLLAVSHAATAFLTRTFSNSIEAVLLSLLLLLVTAGGRSRGAAVALGALVAVGVWARFTFLAFAFPSVVVMVLTAAPPARSTLLVTALLSLASFGATALAMVAADTLWYGAEAPVWTPLNAALYNSRTENLSQHGLHPRWTHLVVNMPLLFGPMAVVALLVCVSGSGNLVMASTVMSSLAVLSAFPHQEPRFLLPLVTPVCLLTAGWLLRVKSRAGYALALAAMVLAGLAGLAFFGGLHQGGLVSATIKAGSYIAHEDQDRPGNLEIGFLATYPPPVFLLPPPDDGAAITSLELPAGDPDAVQKWACAAWLQRKKTVLLVTPATFDMLPFFPQDWVVVRWAQGHWSGEHPSSTWRDMRILVLKFKGSSICEGVTPQILETGIDQDCKHRRTIKGEGDSVA
jgi:phosphatidylinositol glycan class Z